MAVSRVRRGKERTSPTFSSSAVPFQIHRQQPLSNLRIYATDVRASESSPISRRPNMLYPSGQWYTKLGTISAPLFALSLCGSLCLQGFPSRIAPSRFPGEWRHPREDLVDSCLFVSIRGFPPRNVTKRRSLLRRYVTAWITIIINVFRHCYVVTARRREGGRADRETVRLEERENHSILLSALFFGAFPRHSALEKIEPNQAYANLIKPTQTLKMFLEMSRGLTAWFGHWTLD